MENLVSHIAIALTTFAITNIDDLLILSIYFAIPNIRVKEVVTGQYLGITALILISLTGIVLGGILDSKYISLLGSIPIFLGIKSLYELYKGNGQNEESEIKTNSSLSFMNVAIITFANGGDNIGVYTPLFANIKAKTITLYLSIFTLMVGVWCFLGYYLVKHKTVKNIFERYGRIILPFFLIILGSLILFDYL